MLLYYNIQLSTMNLQHIHQLPNTYANFAIMVSRRSPLCWCIWFHVKFSAQAPSPIGKNQTCTHIKARQSSVYNCPIIPINLFHYSLRLYNIWHIPCCTDRQRRHRVKQIHQSILKQHYLPNFQIHHYKTEAQLNNIICINHTGFCSCSYVTGMYILYMIRRLDLYCVGLHMEFIDIPK